jgi:uncharacterized protein (DUF4415 family)
MAKARSEKSDTRYTPSATRIGTQNSVRGLAAKQPVTIRLDVDIVEHYKASGRGWQTKMNADLRRLARLFDPWLGLEYPAVID